MRILAVLLPFLCLVWVALFAPGESLVLRIQGTELPGAGDLAHRDSVNVGRHRVHVGGEYESFLLVPVVRRPETSE